LQALPAQWGPRDWRVAQRTRETLPQMELPFEARRKNMRGAFEILGNVKGKHVAVVDDVMTTGHTLEELAQTLKKAGAASITNLVVARTA
jgi:predicted amidophosphoribosyltransferase